MRLREIHCMKFGPAFGFEGGEGGEEGWWFPIDIIFYADIYPFNYHNVQTKQCEEKRKKE